MLPSPSGVEHCLLHSLAAPERFDGKILRTVLLSDAAAGEEVFAVVRHRGGQCVTVGGFDVLLVSLETPMGKALAACRLGDRLPLGCVLAVDDSLTASAAAQRQAEADQWAESVRRRHAKAAESRQIAAAQAATRQREQEAFERRAAAHFERIENESGSKSPRNDTQLEWVFVKRLELIDE